ncbi:hypothetical protein SLEP1_g22280 [Rubroshorea leprosula]|uniref:RNA helicase n=1 Tax=Rubroshorea leprosula TaxID=152421 RepID=A0AAV5JKQ1_9ROSI|nr:hypothetical protein SLEP1_g22280 [Rubroshorea leprosula]
MAISSATRGGSRRYPPRGWRFSEYSYPWGGDGALGPCCPASLQLTAHLQLSSKAAVGSSQPASHRGTLPSARHCKSAPLTSSSSKAESSSFSFGCRVASSSAALPHYLCTSVDIAKSAGQEAAETITQVSDSVIPAFKSAAQELLKNSGLSAEDLLAKALAKAAGYTEIKSRSLLTSMEDHVTLLLEAGKPIYTPSFAYGVLRRFLPEEKVESVKEGVGALALLCLLASEVEVLHVLLLS